MKLPTLVGHNIIDPLIVNYTDLGLRSQLNPAYLETDQGLKTALRVIDALYMLSEMRYPLNPALPQRFTAALDWIDRNLVVRNVIQNGHVLFPVLAVELKIPKYINPSIGWIGVPIHYHPETDLTAIKQIDQWLDSWYKLGTTADPDGAVRKSAVFCHMFSPSLKLDDTVQYLNQINSLNS